MRLEADATGPDGKGHSLEAKTVQLWWQKQGLQYTVSGYGYKIPTSRMVQLPGSKRWRRVYCCVYGNAGTCYVPTLAGWFVIHGIYPKKEAACQ